MADDGPDGVTVWRKRWKDERYAYRTIFPIEIVFDIGDDGDWGKCRENTIALWGRLQRFGFEPNVDYWPALSGGKGTHTHLFITNPDMVAWLQSGSQGPKPPDERDVVVKAILSPVDGPIVCDPCTQQPNEGSRLLREFGAVNPKTGRRKTLWCHKYTDLPTDRAKAYAMQPLTYPSRVRIAANPIGSTWSRVRQALGRNCPKSPDCRVAMWHGDICDRCPAAL